MEGKFDIAEKHLQNPVEGFGKMEYLHFACSALFDQ
jgi:hypothetical protein